MITVDSSVATALADDHLEYCLLVDLPGPHRITDNVRDLTYDGITYSTEQLLMSAGGLSRKREINADSYEVQVSNIDETIYQDYLGTNYTNQAVAVYLGFLDEDGDLISSASVMPIFKGVIDSWGLTESGSKSTLTIRMTSHWSQWKLIKGRRTNADSHEERYPGDTVFEFSHQDELPIKWGI